MALGWDNESKKLSIGMIVTGALYIPMCIFVFIITQLYRTRKTFPVLILQLALICVYLYYTISLSKYYTELRDKLEVKLCPYYRLDDSSDYCKLNRRRTDVIGGGTFSTIIMILLFILSLYNFLNPLYLYD